MPQATQKEYRDILSHVTDDDIRQAMARSSMLDFTKYTYDEYQVNWHHAYMCRKIDRWVNGEIDRLMFFMPPRHGKSELVSRRLPAFILGKHPNDQVIAASYSSGLSARMNRDVQRIIDTQRYHWLFPQTILARSATTSVGQAGYVRHSGMFEIVMQQGAYVSTGVGGGITGMGADWIIIDDPVKNMQEAMSQTVRDRIWEWYDSTLHTRLESGGRVLLTMTRWHPDDLAGRLLQKAADDPEAEQWEVVSFPALCENPSREGEQRKAGEALWPDKKSREDLVRIRASSSAKVWNSLYQQNPVPDEGDIWKDWYVQKISRADLEQIPLRQVAYNWDTAYTEKEQNSASAYIKAGVWNRNMYITDIGWDWLEFPELIKWMKSKSDAPIYVEDAASGKDVVPALNRQGITAVKQKVEGDKIARTNMITPDGAAGRIHIAEDLYDKLLFDNRQGIIQLSQKNNDIDLNDALVHAAIRLLHGGKIDWDSLFDDDDLMRGGIHA